MESINMVRCFLSKNQDEAGDVRYVPLEIFTLWRFLMERVHNLTVQKPFVSVWVPEDHLDPKLAADSRNAVIEVRFRYIERGGVGRPVTRYFPEENFDLIYGYFRRHFSEENIMEGIQHRKGFWINENVAPYEYPAQ
jgi:hypothetical protein